MKSNVSNPRKTAVSIALALMFLFADLALPQALPKWENEVLDEEIQVLRTSSSFSPSNDTAINSDNPTTNYGSETQVALSGNDSSESRLLFEFNNTIPSGDMVLSANLEITCGVEDADLDEISLYPSRLKQTWNESNSDWNSRDTGLDWETPGADGLTDRDDWSIPFYGYDNNTFSINVTDITQDAVINSRSTINLMISALGPVYDCNMSEATSDQPSLEIVHQTGSHTSGGSLVPNFVEDGAALIDDEQFALTADLTPEVSWENLTGNDVQIQFSTQPDFKQAADGAWYFNSQDNSSIFSISGTTGTMTVPTANTFSNESTMYYRMRAIDSSQTIGQWTQGNFHLPNHDITLENGYASFTVNFSSLGLAEKTIEESYIDSVGSHSNTNYGSDGNISVTSSSSSQQYGLMRLNLDNIGMHSNSSIQHANLTFERNDFSGDAWISIHVMENDDWTENGVTWRRYDGSNTWDDGGRTTVMSIGNFNGSEASDDIEVDIGIAIQNWIDTNRVKVQSGDAPDSSIELMIVASSINEDVTSTSQVKLCSSEGSSCSVPSLEVTYDWDSTGPPTIPTQTAPLDGHGVWNVSSHNLSANTMPTIGWDGSMTWRGNMIVEIASDVEFRNIEYSFDTGETTEFAPSDGAWTFGSNRSLDTGVMYHWRVAQQDTTSNHHSWWNQSSFLVSSLESEYISADDERRIRLTHGNATTLGDAPVCADTYIDSGDPNGNYNDEYEMTIAYNTFPGETSYLMGCDLTSHLLPSGYAVKTSTMKFKLSSAPTGTPVIGVWESRQHNWTEDSATWASYDGVNSWGTSGAKGWERSSLLDTVTVGSSYSSGDWVEFDVTLAVQNAMREGRQVDLIFGIIGYGTGNNRDVYFYGNNQNLVDRPEISFIYVPGSDALPDDPVPSTPLNGSWSVETGINPAPETNPQLGWTYNTSGTSVGGWSVELDTSSNFDSSDLIMATSWTDNGFDVSNSTYDVQAPLDTAETWYWRVRATSSTNQIGNWSETFHFLLPDITTWSIDSNTSAVELHHREAMPSLNIPNFIDSWIADSGIGNTSSQFSSTSIRVGTSTSGENATGLLKIPLTSLPNPQNAHIKNATLNLFSQTSSDTDNAVSIHPSTVDWNESANGSTYDGVNNWSALGAMGAPDRGFPVDIKQTVSSNWMTFDITELVQHAYANGDSHLSLMIVGSIGEGQTFFTSVDGASSEKPWVNLTWTTGNATTPEVAGTNYLPVDNEVVWNSSSHGLLPNFNPTFTWNHTSNSVENWRLYIWNDAFDWRQGWTMFDTRDYSTSEGLDLANNSWTLDYNLTDGETYKWWIQPITDDILGTRGQDTMFHLPKETGNVINSTDAEISIQEGLLAPLVGYPASFVDTFIDTGSSNSQFEARTTMSMGASTVTTSPNHYSQILMQVNWSELPIPGNYEFIDASISLEKISGGEVGQESIVVAVCEMFDDWNENASFNYPTGPGSSWMSTKCDTPFSLTEVSYLDVTADFDITYAVQHAHNQGKSAVNLMFYVASATSDEWEFASSNYTIETEARPELSLTWRTGNQWLPSASSSLAPIDGDTLWNTSASRPTGVDQVSLNWTNSVTNGTNWLIQIGTSSDFTDSNATRLLNLSDNSTFEGTWDEQNLTYHIPENSTWGDFWTYWRVRVDQDHRMGRWSQVNSFRVPGEIGSDDGDGNNTVHLHQGSVFTNSGLLPMIPDATIDSNQASTNLGGNGALVLGISPGGSGESRILIEFDLSELPFPAAMTPTNAMLTLHRYNVSGTSPLTVSAHACNSFSEASVNWNNSPVCSAAEITRSTLLVSQSTAQEWDITSLAQSNIANGNTTLTIMLKAVGSLGSGHYFYDNRAANESERPNLTLEYVDNVDGVIPPGQPTLVYPGDGAVLYNNSEWVLTSMEKPQLSWNAVPNATGYIVTVSDGSNQYKFNSAFAPQINGTTFTFSNNLSIGTVYTWWVQALNESIPGPSSNRRTFALGNPVDHTYNGDNTWTYTFQTGNEVPAFGHTNIRDSYLGNGQPDTNHGSDLLRIGDNCEGAGTECRTVFALDNSQVPLPLAANIHSASINLTIETPPQNAVTLTVHRLLTSAWTQAGSTWNSSSEGNPWSAPGLGSGVEYDPVAISSVVVQPTDEYAILEIGHSGMLMDGDHGWVIMGTTFAGNPSFVTFYSSESEQSKKPVISMNYTNVDNITISPAGHTTDADTTVQYSHILKDGLGAMITGDVEWHSSDGTIDSQGVYSPWSAGTNTITACFGVICSSVNVVVTPGAPTLLVVEDTEETITADESFTISAHIEDQNGNTVPGLTISYTPSNGSMSGATFSPYSSGLQTITVGWNGQTIDVLVTVEGGEPVYYETTGCEEIVNAGTTCTLVWTLHDQYGNSLDVADGGGITWNAGGGVFTEANGTYFATTVGTYNITMVSTKGITHTIPIIVTHGEMASLEIIPSSYDVTADDSVWLNTTRIDIMGNRLSVVIPQSNWTTNDGLIEAGQPAVWHAQKRGTKTIEATYAGISSSVQINISDGAIAELILLIDAVDVTNSLQEMTADEELTIKVKARDNDENQWTVNVAWSVYHPTYIDQGVLMDMVLGSTTMFVPIHASEDLYKLIATYSDANITLETELSIQVEHGYLNEITLPGRRTGEGETEQITADDPLEFYPELFDADGNYIDPVIVSYLLTNKDTGQTENITSIIVGNGGTWEATEVGNWSIKAWANETIRVGSQNVTYPFYEIVDITVSHGAAVSVDINVVADSAKAGDVYEIEIIGTDSDGNQFLESVIWTQNNKGVPQSTISGSDGMYNWSATTAGVHTFKYRSPSGAENEWTVTVIPHQTVHTIELTILSEGVPQLETFDISVRTFDEWSNEIPVPPETVVKLTGRMTAERDGQTGNWTITTLDEGEQTVTISVHNKDESAKITVSGTFLGFFESGGTLYYAGGILAILVVIVLLVVIIMVFRSGESGYDDDDDDDDYYDDDDDAEGPSGPGPSGPGPGGPPPQPVEPQQEDWMSDLRMDDDGTAWAEDQDGNWYYQEPGSDEWVEWAD